MKSLIGKYFSYRINLPKRKRRDRLKELERASPRESFIEADVETASEASSEQDYSYEFAQMEVMMKTLGNNGMIKIIRLLQSLLSLRLLSYSSIQYVPLLGFCPFIFFPSNLTKKQLLSAVT